jgi:hypothetical protein
LSNEEKDFPPACGPCRSRKLDAWRFNAVSHQLRKAMPKPAYHRPALAPAPVPSGRRGLIRRSFPALPAVPRPAFRPSLKRSHITRGLCSTSAQTGIPAFPTLRPRGFNGSGFGSLQDESCRSPRLVPRPRGISPSRRSLFP